MFELVMAIVTDKSYVPIIMFVLGGIFGVWWMLAYEDTGQDGDDREDEE